jgi:hypothetical protein
MIEPAHSCIEKEKKIKEPVTVSFDILFLFRFKPSLLSLFTPSAARSRAMDHPSSPGTPD